MVKILGLPFDDFVKGQFEIRQKELSNHQKSPQNLAVFNSNTSWVRLTSGVKVEPDKARILSEKLNIGQSLIEGNSLAKNLVLWGGITSFSTGSLDPLKGGIGYGINNAYGFLSGPEQGLKPFPGIENISCTYKNNGSLKQATVKLKCFTRSQFEALEAIYLRLGYTVVLEWGNVNYFDNKGEFQKIDKYSIPNLLFKSNDTIDPNTVQTQLYSNKKETNGNYDGMLAKVSNFSWQLNNDLSFDITLNLISVGDIIDSLKVNIGGISNTKGLTDQVNVSGSIQNIVAIQLNRNASRINAFLAELYDEVYKDALNSSQVSKETQNLVKTADTVVQDVVTNKAGEIANYLKSPLVEFRTLYNQWLRFGNIARSGQVNDITAIIVPNTTLSKEDQDFWNGNLNGNIGKSATNNTQLVRNLSNQESDDNKSSENFLKSLDAIESYLNKLKPGDEIFEKLKKVTAQTTYGAKVIILNALHTGFFDAGIEVPGAKYISSNNYTDNIFDNLLERVYGGNW